MTPAAVQVLSTAEVPIFQRGGKVVTMIRTKWMYGDDHGPYTTDIPKDQFTAAALATAQQKLITELNQLK